LQSNDDVQRLQRRIASVVIFKYRTVKCPPWPPAKLFIMRITLDRLLIAVAVILTLNLVTSSYLLHIILPLAKALYLVLVLYIYGSIFMNLFGHKQNKDMETGQIAGFTSAIAVGLIFTTFFFYLVSIFKILSHWVLILFYLAPLFFLLFILKNKNRKTSVYVIKNLRAFLKRPAYEYLIFIFPLIYAALPPSFYDSLAYHLGIPNLYLQNHGFIPTPQFFYANTFIYYEISLIPAVFAGDLVPRLFHLLIGIILVLSAMDFAIHHFKIHKRHILLLTIISMPMTIFLITAVKNDLPSALFLLLGVYYFLKDKKYLSALFWGFSIGIKYTNCIPPAVFLLLYFIKSIKEKHLPTYLKQLVVFGLIIIAVLVPLTVKNYIFTGNPIFPFFHRCFDNKIQYWDATRFTLLEQDAKKLFHSLTDVLKFPISISFEELGSGGIVGPLFLMFLPFLVIKREKRLLLLGFALLTLLVGANFKLSTRVWYIAFIFLSIYAAIAYESISQKIMTVLFFIIIGFNVLTAFGLHEHLYRSYSLFSGKLSVEEYKADAFPTYRAIAFANKEIPPGSPILIVGEAKSYYLKHPYSVASGYDYSILKKYLEKSRTVEEFIAAVKADGFEYIILNLFEFNRLQRDYKRLTEVEHKKALAFLNVLPRVFREEKDGVYVLRI
jgi:hypothetical protein